MQEQAPYQKTRGWYTVSVDTLRALGALLVLAVVAGAGWWVYRNWQADQLEVEAARLIEEVDGLIARVGRERPAGRFEEELAEARSGRQEAGQLLEEGDFAAAVSAGRRSRALLLALLDAGGARDGAGEAQFIAVQGNVEYRRGEQGEWETARARDVLYEGDEVKTAGGGSAEVVFLDGTLYTVRPNTLFIVTRTRNAIGAGTEQAISMEYGWVDLNTAQRGGRVSTPSAEARVARDSEAAVSFDRTTATARFTAFRGELEVVSASGVSKSIGPLEEIRQRGDLLSDPTALPDAPAILRPAAHLETSLDANQNLTLAWAPVENAAHYALQVSRNRLFVDNLIDVEARRKTEATLELRGEGSFLWRVAALDRAGLQGPWSDARSFRVVAGLRPGERGDRTAPPIEIEAIQPYGNLFIFTGRTEPGARLSINGEATSVDREGRFTKTLLVDQEGWSIVELLASDPSGNTSRLRQRVFVEAL